MNKKNVRTMTVEVDRCTLDEFEDAYFCLAG